MNSEPQTFLKKLLKIFGTYELYQSGETLGALHQRWSKSF